MLELTYAVREYAFREGVDLLGITSAESLKGAPKGRRPEDLLPGAKAVVAVGVGFTDPLMKAWYNLPGRGMFEAKSLGRTLHNFWKFKISKFLEDRGYKATIDSEEFIPSLRLNRVFQQAGLGYVGKSQLLITPKYGPRVNLGVVLTDAPLIPNDPYEGNCPNACKLCENHCPSGAISQEIYDARKCQKYIDNVENMRLFSRYFASECEMCMLVCPQGEVKWPYRGEEWTDILKKNRLEGLPFISELLEYEHSKKRTRLDKLEKNHTVKG